MSLIEPLAEPDGIAVIIPLVATAVFAATVAMRLVMRHRQRAARIQSGIGPEHVLFEDDEIEVRETTTHAA